ncbi:MAG: LysR family transcriptional regulator [Hyphomicrobiales bacterium]
MLRSDLSLKWLEVFQFTATLGSIQKVAHETGLSISTVSHHLRSLENRLGVDLLDHSRRPMVLTPAGSIFLKYVDEALTMIRKGQAAIVFGNILEAQRLRLGLIEDFDSDIAPELAVNLASGMPNCDFIHRTCASHAILELLRQRQIDLGVANRPSENTLDLLETPFLRDPFVLAAPSNSKNSPEELLAGNSTLPFLRYSTSQHISQQIETHMRRLRISLPNRFEVESNQTMMAMIAAGSGWAITTPLSFMRAQRFHSQVQLHPFPGKGFAREIFILTTPECAEATQLFVSNTLRSLVQKRVLQPALEVMPWLGSTFRLSLDEQIK